MKKCAIILVVFTMSLTAAAASFQKEHVSSNATWVLHLDVADFLGTKTGKYLLHHAKDPDISNKLAFVQATMHFDPCKDLTSITLYGADTNNMNHVAILDGSFDSKQLLTILRANETHQQYKYSQRIIHSWINENKGTQTASREVQIYACFWDKDTIVFSPNMETVKRTLDTMAGKLPHLKVPSLLSALTSTGPATFLKLGVNVQETGSIPPQASMFQGTRSARLHIAEQRDHLDIQLGLTMSNAEQAQQMQMVCQGMLAAILLQQNQPPELLAFLKSLRVSATDQTLHLSIRYPVSTLIPILKKAYLKKNKKATPPTIPTDNGPH